MALYDIVKEDLENGMSKEEIIDHVKTMVEYFDLDYSDIGNVVDAIRACD